MRSVIRMSNIAFATLLLIAALFFAASSRPALAQSVPPLGAAESFAALAGTTLTATGAGTVISGNVGVSPGLAVTGFPPAVVVNGQIYTGAGSLAGPAQASALIAYNNLKGQTCGTNLTGKILGETPGFLTLSPGVYCFDTSAQLNATLTLNDGGDPNAIFIFQIGTTLTTASSSKVQMSSGGRGTNVFWQIGSSATIGTSTTFRGHIIANTSITFTTSASTTGRVFALNGAVTIDTIVLDALPTGIQFSSSTYTVAESGASPSIVITVQRTGDTTQPVTVDYVTSDDSDPSVAVRCDVVNTGIASSRCDFETAIGTLRFAANETSRTFTVLINQDSHLEGPENLTLTLSNPTGGASLGTPSTATLQITDDLTEPSTNAIDATGDFVRQHYLDFLNREAETGGFNAWVNLLNGCASGNTACDRVTVSQSFFGSPEFKSKGYFATRFYFAAFNRNPQFLEFSGDLSRLNGATPAESDAAKASFPAEFTQRAEFHTAMDGLTNAQYVDALIVNTGVAYSNRNQMIADLNAATKTRAQVLNDIAEATQFVQNLPTLNRAFVLAEYFGYLRRNPETAGFNSWIVYLTANPGDFRTMVNGFVNSIEYRLRFGTP